MRIRKHGLLLALAVISELQAQTSRVSRPGEYSGYSAPTYDSYQRSSFYLPMRDGVRLAVDLLRPTRDGAVHTERLPVIWTHHRYNRAFTRNDSIIDYASGFGRGVDVLLKHGYVVAAVDTRGGGASFGTQQGFFMPDEARDAYEVTEWLAAQPWSSGKIGMVGRSYLGITQLFTAAQRPPHLTAIFPEMYVFEWYPFIHPGGVFRDDFFSKWQFLTHQLDNGVKFSWNGARFEGVAPVNGPMGPAQRDSAIAGHATNRDMLAMWRGVPLRGSIDSVSGKDILTERSPSTYLEDINASGVAVYGLAGWFDAFPRDAFLWFANLTVPQKLVVGPWFHGQTDGFDLSTERLRWFDYWLKGINNGIMREPPIRYRVIDAPDGSAWRTARRWPIAEARPTPYYLGATAAGDRHLTRRAPTTRGTRDHRVMDTTATLGPGNRWANTYGGAIGYPNLAPNDEKGLSWTTPPLSAPLEVVGHPVVHLWLSSSTGDADVIALLEEVTPDGRSVYVSEGVLRASHRRQGRAPYRNLGLPWPASRADDLDKPGTAVVPLVFDLLPTAKHFRAGHRIRLTVLGADRDAHVAVTHGAPDVTIWRDATRPSHIVLPVVRPR